MVELWVVNGHMLELCVLASTRADVIVDSDGRAFVGIDYQLLITVARPTFCPDSYLLLHQRLASSGWS